MEGHCSTGQSPQWAVVPEEEEEGRSHSSYLPAYEDGTDNVPKRRHVKFRRRGITRKKAYNNVFHVTGEEHNNGGDTRILSLCLTDVREL